MQVAEQGCKGCRQARTMSKPPAYRHHIAREHLLEFRSVAAAAVSVEEAQPLSCINVKKCCSFVLIPRARVISSGKRYLVV